jgi:hypothetical protein
MAVQSGSGSPDMAPRANQKNASDGVQLSGDFTYLFSDGNATVSVTQPSNTTAATGPLRLSLWASKTQEPSRDGEIPGSRLVIFAPLDPLTDGTSNTIVTRTAAYTAPPFGTYWIVLSLERFDPASCPDVVDGFCPEDNMSSFKQETWAATESAPIAAVLENPAQGSYQSGIGVISGWACSGQVGVTIDGMPLSVPSGSVRADTAIACGGGTNNGFGLLVNFNDFGPGSHTAQLIVNGAPSGDPSTFTVTVPQGEFITGVSKTVTVTDFPASGQTTTLVWQQSLQNFTIQSVAP